MRNAALLVLAALALTGCSELGKVEQGRVIAYDAQTREVTLIREPNVLPPVTVEAPENRAEMGPAPAAGGIMRVDTKNHRITVYDRAAQAFRSFDYQTVAEKQNVVKNPGTPIIDRAAHTITVYASRDKALITFAATPEMLAMPASTWHSGDVVRYYYKDPAHALRMMNVTKTDVRKAG